MQYLSFCVSHQRPLLVSSKKDNKYVKSFPLIYSSLSVSGKEQAVYGMQWHLVVKLHITPEETWQGSASEIFVAEGVFTFQTI